MGNLKAFCLRARRRKGRPTAPQTSPAESRSRPSSASARLGPQKAPGNDTRPPAAIVDIGNPLGSPIGLSESGIRRAPKRADDMAPCCPVCDETEKGLAGELGSGQTDSGAKARFFGS